MNTDTHQFKLILFIRLFRLFYSRKFNNDTENSSERGIVMEHTYLIFMNKTNTTLIRVNPYATIA